MLISRREYNRISFVSLLAMVVYTSDFLLVQVMRFFQNVASPTCGETHMCSHTQTGETDNNMDFL